MALPPSSAANQTAALGLLSCLPMTRRTATDSGDEQIFAQNNKTRHVTRATKDTNGHRPWRTRANHIRWYTGC